MRREYPLLPKISFACADVRDVALAHIRAMVIKQAAGMKLFYGLEHVYTLNKISKKYLKKVDL